MKSDALMYGQLSGLNPVKGKGYVAGHRYFFKGESELQQWSFAVSLNHMAPEAIKSKDRGYFETGIWCPKDEDDAREQAALIILRESTIFMAMLQIKHDAHVNDYVVIELRAQWNNGILQVIAYLDDGTQKVFTVELKMQEIQ